ncbi:MAG: HAMP domain-containing protein [Candidatus Omnitrophica bacterium]|nr:HAMP domain-containing protein [Candidatus Omnitrophota bacterium]MBU4346517.1 HAMP domain-containing protein [Candidatus Omnitrophota bacterium]MBU4473501.1 HAMP domain-containing protein [Candidatus Omnitrophota bacterium]MCG2706786.1 HAMP domain-containing protein [Candidatus Omnitrophota bacterium]
MKGLGRRRKYFIKPGLQVRYLRVILIAVILPVCLFSVCLYYLIFYMMAEQLGIPESIAYNIVPVVTKINLILLFGLPIISIGILFWGVLISHRIAGPLYRLEKELDKIAKGDFSLRLKIRSKDELGSIVKGVNKILDKIEEKQ